MYIHALFYSIHIQYLHRYRMSYANNRIQHYSLIHSRDILFISLLTYNICVFISILLGDRTKNIQFLQLKI